MSEKPTEMVRAAFSRMRAGDLEQAERLARQALAGDPQCFDALVLLGMLAHRQGRNEEADDLLARASAGKPHAADVLVLRGNVLRALGMHEQALALLDAAVALQPDFLAALVNRGNTLLTLARWQEALAAYDRALALQPDDAGALTHRGIALQELGRLEEALASHSRAVELAPERVAAWINRGNALRVLGRFDEAIVSCDRALALAPRHADALLHKAQALLAMGNALQALGRYDEALQAADRALSVTPGAVGALNNRGNALRALERHGEALESYRQVLAQQPDDVSAHWNEALTLLTMGDFEHGWNAYEWRLRGLSDAPHRHRPETPRWSGSEDLTGKTILLLPEQGFGDAIQFLRYAPLVARRGARVVVVCREPLAALARSVAGVAEVVTTLHAAPEADYQALLMSLPLAFGTRLDTIPDHIPYLTADAQRIERWRERLGSVGSRRTVGLAWRGNSDNSDARMRDCPAELLAPLLTAPDCAFFSLQRDASAVDLAALSAAGPIVDLAGELFDFSETAAAISALDLVISVDTAVAHLAGALGRPALVLLRYSADWRWMIAREDSPWYPSLRLFRQRSPGDWRDVVRRVAAEQ